MYKYSYYICVAGLTIRISEKKFKEITELCKENCVQTLNVENALRFEYVSLLGEHCYIGLYKI